MIRRPSTIAASVVGLLLLEAVGVSWRGQDTPRFTSGVQFVEVEARVTDRDGKVVRGLTLDDFTLLEDGVPQKISTASFIDLGVPLAGSRWSRASVEGDVATNAASGRTWVLLFGPPFQRSQRVARLFIEEAVGPNDQIAVVHAFGPMTAAQGFTRSRRLILAAIDRAQDVQPVPDAGRVAFQVLEDVCRRLSALSGGRKSVIFFDPPAVWIPSIGRGDPRGLGVDVYFAQRNALRCATRNNVAVYVVSTSGLTTGLGNLAGMAALRSIADDTGADAIVNSNDFEDGFQRFVRDGNQYYLIGYVPAVEHRDGEFHNLTVRVNRPGVTVRSRRGYYAPEADPSAKPNASAAPPPGETLSADLSEALRMPLSINGLTIDLAIAPFRGPAGNGLALLTAQVRGADLVLGAGESIEVAYRAMTNEGGALPGAFHTFKLELSAESRAAVESSGLRFVDWLPLASGRHQVRFAVHQPNGATGMVVGDVEVPDFVDAAVSMSGVVLTSEQLRNQRTMKMDEALLKVLGGYPTAERSFKRRDVVTAYAEIYTNASTRPVPAVVTVGPAGRPNDARVIEARVVVAEPGRAHYVARVPLATLRPGDYVLTFEARAGREAVTRQLLFTVTD